MHILRMSVSSIPVGSIGKGVVPGSVAIMGILDGIVITLALGVVERTCTEAGSVTIAVLPVRQAGGVIVVICVIV